MKIVVSDNIRIYSCKVSSPSVYDRTGKRR